VVLIGGKTFKNYPTASLYYLKNADPSLNYILLHQTLKQPLSAHDIIYVPDEIGYCTP